MFNKLFGFMLTWLLLIAAFLLSACGAAAPTAPASAPYVPAAAATSAPAAAPTPVAKSETNNSNGPAANTSAVDRRVIKTAQLSATVDNVDVAVMRITGITTDVGGYLVGSRTFVAGGPGSSRRGAQVTIAVPVDRYEEALNLVRRVAYTIDSDSTSSADVTEQYTDLQSRLRNLEATAARIRDFLGKATTVEEALKINAQLSEVDKQIEEIKGKLNATSARSTFSTITIDMHEPLPTPTPTMIATNTPIPTATPTATPNVWRPDQTFTTAVTVQTNIFSALVRTLGDFLIWFTIVVLPYLLGLVLIGGVVRWFISLFSGPSRTS